MPLPHELRFDTNNYFIQLGVACPSIPQRITDETTKRGYLPKPETHISVVVTSNSVQLKAVVEASENPHAMRDSIKALYESYTWEYELRDTYLLQERVYKQTSDRPEHTRRSIIQLVTLPDLELFYTKLMELAGVTLTLPVPHITLFAWSDYEPMMVQGIGLSSKEQFNSYSRGEI